MKQERINLLKVENVVWLIYVFFAFFGIKANNLEIEDLKAGNESHKKEYKSINIIIILISICIYLFFIYSIYKRYKKEHNPDDAIITFGTFLILIAAILFLFVEWRNREIVPNIV